MGDYADWALTWEEIGCMMMLSWQLYLCELGIGGIHGTAGPPSGDPPAMRTEHRMPAKMWRVFLCPDTISWNSMMRLEKLFIMQDDRAHTPENHRVWQTLHNSGTDSCGLVEVRSAARQVSP
jgi:hypothetical protein